MRFRLTEPTRLLVDRRVVELQAEDATGRFGVRDGHEPFVTVLEPCILVWRFARGDGRKQEERFAAVRGGALRVSADGVDVAARSARLSDRLEDLEEEVRRARRETRERGKENRAGLYQMQLSAWRRLVEYEDAS